MSKATQDKIDAMSKGVELNRWKERSKKIKELADDFFKSAAALKGLGATLIDKQDKENTDLGSLLEIMGEHVEQKAWDLHDLLPGDAGKEEAA